MRTLRTIALAASAAAVLAIPAAPAAAASTSAAAPPEIVEDVVRCATGTVGAYYRWLQGYPQPYYCQIG